MDQIWELRTQGKVNFFGSSNINQNNLVFNTAGLLATGNEPVSVDLFANELTILNEIGGTLLPVVSNPENSLMLSVNSLKLGGGEFSFQGFDSVNATVEGDTLITGNSIFNLNGDFKLNTPRLTAINGVESFLNVTGNIEFVNESNIVANTNLTGIGSTLRVIAESINLNTDIQMRVGEVDLISTTGDIVLNEAAKIDVSGVSIDVANLEKINLPGGKVNLKSNSNIETEIGSKIVVDAAGNDGKAGDIELLAENGDINLLGDLSGVAPIDTNGNKVFVNGGNIKIDGQSLTQSFQNLNSSLNEGGFTGSRDIRLRTGSIDIQSDDVIRAQEIKITADGFGTSIDEGNIRVSGSLVRLI